ncbi:MAG: phage antirepressor KilAC domain-containing protein [Cetobacterium sp.]
MQIVKVENMNGTLVTTSNRVAEELGVNHRDLLEKIDGYINKFRCAETSAGFYIPSNYIHAQNKQEYRNYLITEKGVAQLIGGYSSAVERAFDLNVAYINKFEEMKTNLKTTVDSYMIADPVERAKKWIQEAEERKALEIELKENAPRVNFAKTVELADEGILVREFSKLLGNEGIDLGEKKLYAWLRNQGYICKGTNEPTQKSIQRGFMSVTERVIATPKGGKPRLTPKITGKGQVYLLEKIKSELLIEEGA